jgi:hypothetical protein
MRVLGVVRRGFLGIAILWLNICLLVLIANLGAAIYLALRGPIASNASSATLDPKPMRRFFPELSDDELADFLGENARVLQYEPFTQFREKPSSGRFVNVHPAGFRLSKNQGPWPPDDANFNVFLFGGSTTFGYGVPDDYTIASYLQRRLSDLGTQPAPRVYNFGRGAYYSTQERILFERLLAEGSVPRVAIFIDGLNDFFLTNDQPVMTAWLAQYVAQLSEPRTGATAAKSAYREALTALPIFQLFPPAKRLDSVFGYPAPPRGAAKPTPPSARRDDAQVLDTVIRRYRSNMRLIRAAAAEFGARAAFVWQPVPTYNYDAESGSDPPGTQYSRLGYPLMADLRAGGAFPADFVWCADLHAGAAPPLYMDSVHYAPVMSDRIAACIVSGLRQSQIIP